MLVERVYGGGILIGLDHGVDITELSAPAEFPTWIFNFGHTKKLLYMKVRKKKFKKLKSYFFSGENRLPFRFSCECKSIRPFKRHVLLYLLWPGSWWLVEWISAEEGV